ncbi:MAG: hypothetical protein AB1644_12435 [Candidatus Zixiibacteriota bacterium]
MNRRIWLAATLLLGLGMQSGFSGPLPIPVHRFLRSLPVRIIYRESPTPERPSYSRGEAFSTWRYRTTLDTGAVESFIVIRNGFMVDHTEYSYFFPHNSTTARDTLMEAADGQVGIFRSNERTKLATEDEAASIQELIAQYDREVRAYVSYRDAYARDKRELRGEIAIVAAGTGVTALLLASDKKRERNAGYICAGVLGLGVAIDIACFPKFLRLKKERDARYAALSQWDEQRTQRILDSLSHLPAMGP